MADRPKETKHVSVKGTDDQLYEGEFTWVRRNISDIPAIAAETSKLLKGQPVGDSQMGQLTQMIAELRVVTVAAPAWWDFDTLEDDTVLVRVYNEYCEWRDQLFRLRRTQGKAAAGGNPGAPDQGSPG